jgi:hypothetical protein
MIITQNIELLTIILVAICVVILGFVITPLLRKKGVKAEDTKTVEQLVVLVKHLVSQIKFENQDSKKNALLVFEVTEIVVRYIEHTMKLEDNDKKKLEAIKIVGDILSSTGFDLTEDQKILIEVGIESAVSRLSKTY